MLQYLLLVTVKLPWPVWKVTNIWFSLTSQFLCFPIWSQRKLVHRTSKAPPSLQTPCRLDSKGPSGQSSGEISGLIPVFLFYSSDWFYYYYFSSLSTYHLGCSVCLKWPEGIAFQTAVGDPCLDGKSWWGRGCQQALNTKKTLGKAILKQNLGWKMVLPQGESLTSGQRHVDAGLWAGVKLGCWSSVCLLGSVITPSPAAG